MRIYKRPEFFFSELPSGYERGEDPFTYHDGASRAFGNSVIGSDDVHTTLNKSVDFEN